MRSVISWLAPLAFTLVLAPPAGAETKVFFVENQPDGYGIDQCLASGANCGRPMASAYCQQRQYGKALSFRKVDPGQLPAGEAGSDANCRIGSCANFIAIECER